MRIVFLLTTSLESPYGLGRCWPFARELARMGHTVHIAALHHDLTPTVERHSLHEGVQIHYVGRMHVHKVGNQTIYYGPMRLLWVLLTGFLGLLWQALTLRADIYHIGKPHLQNSLAGLLVGQIYRHSTVLLDYDDWEVVPIAQATSCNGGCWLGWKPMFPNGDGVSVHSTLLYRRLQRLGDPRRQSLAVAQCD